MVQPLWPEDQSPLLPPPPEGAGWAALMRDMATPPHSATLHSLAEHWAMDILQFSAARPPMFEDYPELSLRLRGAFGAALAQQPATRGLPHAYHVLFSPTCPWGADAPPRPFILRGWIEETQIFAELRLFGWATAWREAARNALHQALEGGIALSETMRRRIPLHVEHVTHTRCAFVDVPAHPRFAAMRFRTPVALRQRAHLHATPSGLLRSLPRRISAMARWQGVRLSLDLPGLEATLAQLDYDTQSWHPYQWQRHSRRQGATPIPMGGWLGTLTVRGNLGDYATLLALAETCNIGSHAGLGLGWFDLVMV